MSDKNRSKLQVNEKVVRLIAAQTMIIMALTLFTQWLFPAILLTVDFALRAFTNQLSPLAAVSNIVTDVLRLTPKLLFAAPKKFASSLGFIFSLTVLILLMLKLYFAADIIGGILILCALLESFFNVCLGCYIYSWIFAPVVNRTNLKSKRKEASY